MEIRKLIKENYDAGMSVKTICNTFRVGKSSVYRFKERYLETGTIEPTYQNCGRKPEVCAEKLEEMDALIAGNPDITLTEIKEEMHLSIQKSQISNIVRLKLGYRYKKRWYMPVNVIGQT
jgi:transposase